MPSGEFELLPGLDWRAAGQRPREYLQFWNNYRLPWRLETGVGGNFVSSRTASSTVPLDPITGLVKQVPGIGCSTLWRASSEEHIDLQVNVNNLANRYYYDDSIPRISCLGPAALR